MFRVQYAHMWIGSRVKVMYIPSRTHIHYAYVYMYVYVHTRFSCVICMCMIKSSNQRVKETKLDLTCRPSTATSRWLPAKWRHFQVTSGYMRSRDVNCCHVTASCEWQPCRGSNVPKTWLIGRLQPLPGDIRWNDVTSGSLPVTWGHYLSPDCHFLRFTAL